MCIYNNRQFLLQAAFEKLEDEWLAAKARETLKNLEKGRDKLVSWDEVKKPI